MSGGKACDKQAAQYTGKQPDGGSVVTRRDTAAAENEVHSSGHLLLAADAFAAALEAIPPDDWRRTWAAGRTIMLRRTSKSVKSNLKR